jgi:hypothetical protein
VSSALAGFLLVSAACGGEEMDQGLPDGVRNVLSEEDIQRLENLGLDIHRGSAPPSIEGRYFTDSRQLVASSFDDSFSPGHRFVNATYEFSDQVGSELVIELQEGSVSMGEGVGGFISGQDQSFSVFAIIDNVTRGVENRTIEIYSGRLVADGIADYQIGLYMDAKEGDEDNRVLIPEQTGRLVHEADQLAERR